jgi:hypothetical protein
MATSLINTECKRYGCIKNLLACYVNCRYSTKCDDLKREILDKTDQAAKDISTYLGERGRKPIMIQIMKRGVKFADIASVKNILPAKNVENIIPVKPARAKVERPETRIKSVIKSPPPNPVVGASAKTEARKELARPKRKKGVKRARPKSSPSLGPVESSPASKTVNVRKARAASYLEKTQALPGRKTARRRKKIAKIGDARITKATRRSSELNQRESITMPKRIMARSVERPVEKEAVSNITPGEVETYVSSKAKTPRAPRRKSPSKSRPASRNGKVYIILEGKSASVVDEQGLMQHLFTNPSATARYFEASEVEARVHIVLKK